MSLSTVGILFNSFGVRLARAARPLQTGRFRQVYQVAGMHCTGCQLAVETSLQELPQVTFVQADYESGEVMVWFDSGEPGTGLQGEIAAAIGSLGFQVTGQAS